MSGLDRRTKAEYWPLSLATATAHMPLHLYRKRGRMAVISFCRASGFILCGWPHSGRFMAAASSQPDVLAHPSDDRSRSSLRSMLGHPFKAAAFPRPNLPWVRLRRALCWRRGGRQRPPVSPQQADNRRPPSSALRSTCADRGHPCRFSSCPLFSDRIADFSGAGAGLLSDRKSKGKPCRWCIQHLHAWTQHPGNRHRVMQAAIARDHAEYRQSKA